MTIVRLVSVALLVPAFTGLLAQTVAIAPSAKYPANLSSVVVAGLSNNNEPDIVGLDNTSNAVAVLKNEGSGKYGAATYYATSGAASGLSIGDFNGDGKLDVAIAIGVYNAAEGKVGVFLGNGDGTLQMPHYYTVPIPANSIAVADFNNDNRPDIAVIGNTNDNGTNKVVILSNTGSSFTQKSFTAPTYFTANGLGPDADYISNLVQGDFNGDGRTDLAYFDSCTQCDPSEEVLFILANTTTGWEPKMPTGGTGSESLTAADIDGDGLADLVIPYAGCYTPCVGVEVEYMKSDFTVAKSVALDVLNEGDGPTPQEVVVGDFNNDGIMDIAGYSTGGADQDENPIGPGIMMWTGEGNRSFHGLKYYDQPHPPAQVDAFYTAAGFINKNGTRDLVVPLGTESQVWLNTTSTAADPCAYPTSAGIHVCAPKENVASGTVHFLATARTSTQPLLRIELWIDGHKKFQVFSDRLKINLAVANGRHTADFYEVGATGLHIKKSMTFTVGH